MILGLSEKLLIRNVLIISRDEKYFKENVSFWTKKASEQHIKLGTISEKDLPKLGKIHTQGGKYIVLLVGEMASDLFSKVRINLKVPI